MFQTPTRVIRSRIGQCGSDQSDLAQMHHEQRGQIHLAGPVLPEDDAFLKVKEGGSGSLGSE